MEEIEAAAENGNAEAQNQLGLIYGEGRGGVPVDELRAVECYRKAADQGMASAQFNLGVHYEEGRGVAKDYGQAVKLYRQAAEQGLAVAQFAMGRLREEAGRPEDAREAVVWYRKAAEQGHAAAQQYLGFALAEGGDYTQAVHWYARSAVQGNAAAQNNLAVLLFEGKGVPQDYARAYLLYSLAAAQGLEESHKGREAVAKKMTREQIAEGQRLAAGFAPSAEAVEQRTAAPDGPGDEAPEAPEWAAMPRMMKTDITNLVERLELFEDRLGVRIEAVYACSEQVGSDLYVKVNGELHPRDGAQLSRDITVEVDVHDPAGRVLGTSAGSISSDSFFGFETFVLVVNLGGAGISKVSKVRLYPKPG